MPIPYVLCCIHFRQGITQMLTSIPEMIFIVSAERDDDISGVVDVWVGFLSHIDWLSFL